MGIEFTMERLKSSKYTRKILPFSERESLSKTYIEWNTIFYLFSHFQTTQNTIFLYIYIYIYMYVYTRLVVLTNIQVSQLDNSIIMNKL